MNTDIRLGLEGAFKVDLFSGGKFVSTTDWFSNFITDTGLNYPKYYTFADCFRFLSIGYGNQVNKSKDGGAAATTGLELPFCTFETNKGLQSGQWIDWRGYETGSNGQSSACGTVLTSSGPRFFRAWNIPTGDSSVTIDNGPLNISEFMVSPGDNRDATGRKAFGRIRRNLSIPNGFKALVSYQLKINIDTGATSFAGGTFNTTYADSSDDPTSFVNSWGNLEGKYRQVYHGFRCVDDKGCSYVPRYGDLMEPSGINLSQLVFYLSPDNSQFEVNSLGGVATSELKAYRTDGLMKTIDQNVVPSLTFIRTLSDTSQEVLSGLYYNPTNDQVYHYEFPEENNIPTNIRLGDADQLLNAPSVGNYKESPFQEGDTFNYQVPQDDAFSKKISFATPGYQQYEQLDGENLPKQKAVFSSRFIRSQLAYVLPNGDDVRTPQVIRKAYFTPISSMGYNTRFASLVLAYCANPTASAGNRIYYPYMDCLFKDSSGSYRMPHYRWISGIVLTQRGTGICNAAFSIVDQRGITGSGIQQFARIQTVQGGFTGTNYEKHSGYYTGNERYWLKGYSEYINPTGQRGDIMKDIITEDGKGHGYGAVLMLSGEAYDAGQSPFPSHRLDYGLIPKLSIAEVVPDSNHLVVPLYWPHPLAEGAQLMLRCDYVTFYDKDSLTAPYNMTRSWSGKHSSGNLAASGWCCPTGYIVHFETSGDDSYGRHYYSRLLPHGAFPNNAPNVTPDDIYDRQTQTQGGLYPALGYDNSLEMSITLSWRSPCGGDTSNCTDPP